MVTRLETLSPELVGRLRLASAEKQRRAGVIASEFALNYAKVDSPLVNEVLGKMLKAENLSPDKKAEVEQLAANLDDEYFDLQDAADEGRKTSKDYLRVFAQARAVASLTFADGPDAFESASEAIYEAALANDDNEKLFALVNSELAS